MPGVLILEAIAQAGGFLLLNTIENPEKKLIYFTAVNNARFKKLVIPGDQIFFEVQLLKFRLGTCKIYGKATVNNHLVASSEIMATVVNRRNQINNIHSTALVNNNSTIGKNVDIGPFVIIEDNVSIGDNTKIFSSAVVKKNTKIGENCKIFQGAIIGEIPQDLKFDNEFSKLIIGNNTIIREYVTINRGTKERGETTIGNNVLLMAYVHIGHDTDIKDYAILANSVQVGGHVEVGHYSIIGGSTPIHQFCKIGDHSMIGGGLRIVQDVPPYIIAAGEPLKFNGINSIGLRRRKFDIKARKEIKEAYIILYKMGLNVTQAINKIKNDINETSEIKNILQFIDKSNRGLIS